MPSDLENALIKGGIMPAAAKLISNAIDNAGTSTVRTGRQLADATMVERMRLIDSDTRRYVLTNLDYPAKDASRARFQPRGDKHPYDESQPASSNPTIATPNVTAGQYISVTRGTQNEVAQAEVGLRVSSKGGTHARVNPGTGEIEAVPISVEIAQEQFVEATVEERPDKTVIKIALKGLGQFTDSTGKELWGFVRS